jgi:hypothetical protein
LIGLLEITKQKEMDISGTWNVKSFCKTGSLIVAREIRKGLALNQQAIIHFSMEVGMRIMN